MSHETALHPPSAVTTPRSPAGPPADQRGRRKGAAARRERFGVVFVSPFVLALTLFMIVPIVYAVYESLYTTKLIGGTTFSGLTNYRQVLASAQFWSGVRRVALFTVIQVPITIGLATFFAAVFDAGICKFGKLFRTIYFVPFAVPAVVASVMWSFLLLPRLGPFTKFAAAIGFPHTNFFSTRMMLFTVIVIVIWEWTGYNMTILFTALRAVPRTVTEAALLEERRSGESSCV